MRPPDSVGFLVSQRERISICQFPPPPFWAVLMSTHEIVTALLGLMNPYNCCTNILNLIACNVVNTQSSLPIRGALAEIIQNSGKSKIIYVRLWRPTFDAGQLNHLCNSILFKLGGTFIFTWNKKAWADGRKGLKNILGVGEGWHSKFSAHSHFWII